MHIDIYGLFDLDLDDFIGSSVAVLGIKGSGKSNTAAVLMEECLANGVPIFVVDITGEYYTLKERYPSVTTIGHSRDVNTPVDVEINYHNVREVAQMAYENASQVVFDMSGIQRDQREELLQDYLSVVWASAPAKRYPLVVFVEEAHNFIPQRSKSLCKDTMIDIATEGRKWGLSLVIIGQRSSRIEKDALTQCDICFLHNVVHPSDMQVYIDLIPRQKAWVRDKISKLNVGQALVVQGQNVVSHQIRLRHTRHVGYTPSLADLPNRPISLADMVASKYE